MRLIKKFSLLLFASSAACFLLAGSISAQEMKKETDWEFMAEIYLWGASVDGKTVSGTDIEVEELSPDSFEKGEA